MNHEEIKKALQNKGHSFTSLAKATGRTYQSLTVVSQRKARSVRAAMIIAAGLGLSVEDVFPDIPEYRNKPADEYDKEAAVNRAKEALVKAGLGELVA